MRNRCRVLFLVFLAVFIAGSALAQTTGDLDGSVTDQNGGPLPGEDGPLWPNHIY